MTTAMNQHREMLAAMMAMADLQANYTTTQEEIEREYFFLAGDRLEELDRPLSMEDMVRVSKRMSDARGYANLKRHFVPLGHHGVDFRDYRMNTRHGIIRYARDVCGHYGIKPVVKTSRRFPWPRVYDTDKRFRSGDGGSAAFNLMTVKRRGGRFIIEVSSSARTWMQPSELSSGVLHEVAHVLSWPAWPHHDGPWLDACALVGAEPDPTWSGLTLPRHCYGQLYVCRSCGAQIRYPAYRWRSPDCRECGGPLRRQKEQQGVRTKAADHQGDVR